MNDDTRTKSTYDQMLDTAEALLGAANNMLQNTGNALNHGAVSVLVERAVQVVATVAGDRDCLSDETKLRLTGRSPT